MVTFLLIAILLVLLFGAAIVRKIAAKVVLGALVALMIVLLLGRCSKSDEPITDELYVESVNYAIPETLAEVKAKVSEYAWDFQMSADQYPTTFALLGEKRFGEANELLKWAAAVGAQSPKCDNVGASDVSETSSRKNLLFFVDCDNGKRIWVSEAKAEAAKLKWQK